MEMDKKQSEIEKYEQEMKITYQRLEEKRSERRLVSNWREN
jgi:hypothetical protein